MTKITTYNRGIIVDGHADTKEECETITLLCDSLAKDKNFKQVAYDKGYAAFERVGHTEELKFALPIEGNITVNFDAGIQSVDFKHGSATNTFTTSGESYNFFTEPGNDIILTANLKSGYSLKSSSLGSVSGNTITIPINKIGANMACTLVSEASTVKKSVDLTTLSGWANLAPGNHTIKIVAKGTGYRDSEKSSGVSVTKPAQVYTDCLTFTGESSEFTLKATNKTWDGTLQWSTDHNTWTTLTGTEAMQSVGKKLYLRGKGNTEFYASGSGVEWRLSALAGCSGDIRVLFDWETKEMAPYYSYWCYKMFYGCANLTTTPELPVTNLGQYCYKEMFYGCTNLTTAPELSATTLKKGCYQSMFQGCTTLKINTSSGNKIFICPSTIPDLAVDNMFTNTGGTFKGTPTAGNTYYWTE